MVELSPHALRGRPPGCGEGVEDSNLLPGAVDGRFSMGLDASSTSDLGESLKKKKTTNKQLTNKNENKNFTVVFKDIKNHT